MRALGKNHSRSGIAAVTFAILALLAGNPVASAATKTWNNASGGSWGVDANWDTAAVPLSTENVAIGASGFGTITLDGDRTCAALTFNSGNTGVINSGTPGASFLTVTGTLTSSATVGVEIAAPLTHSGATLSVTGTGTLTISGPITSSILQIKTGAGRLLLTADNSGTLTSAVRVSAGTLAINSPNALGSGTLTLGGGGLENAGGSPMTINNALALTAGTSTVSGGNITFTNNGTVTGTPALTVSNTQTVLSGNLAGGGILNKGGTGTLVLSGSNSGLGGTTVTGGTLQFASASNLGGTLTLSGGVLNSVSGSPVTLANPLVFTGGASTVSGANMVFTNTATLTAATTLTVNNTETRLSGSLSGAFALTKAGTGTLTLSDTSNAWNGLTVTAGTLNVTSARSRGALAVSGGTLNVQAATTGTSLAISGGKVEMDAALTLGTGAVTLTAGELIADAGSFTNTTGIAFNGTAVYLRSGSYSPMLGSGANDAYVRWNAGVGGGFAAYGGDLTLDINGGGATDLVWNVTPNFIQTGAALQLGSASATDKVTLVDNLNLGAADRTVRVDDGSAPVDAEMSGTLSGTAALIKSGTGTLLLSGANGSFTGSVKLSAGTVQFTSSNNLGSGTITLGGGGLNNASGGPMTINNPLALTAGTSTVSGDNMVFTNTATLLGDTTLTVNNAETTLAGDLSGTFDLTKAGTGKLVLSGTGSVYSITVSGGALYIQAGGQIRTYDIYEPSCIGFSSGSTGVATVTGAGSQWTNSGELYVGNSGSGVLNIEAGGRVSSYESHIGENSGSTGAATVTGAGSLWTTSYYLYVGRYGSGMLTVADGGMVTAGTLYASLSDLHGDGTITASGAVLDADMVFDGTYGAGDTRVAFGTGGTLNLNTDGTAFLGAGYRAAGTLTIQAGAQVSGEYGYLGFNSGSTGTATVTGAGSRWTNSTNLYVGYSGSGALTIEAGGLVSNASGSIGANSGSIGAATVTGAGSRWTNSSYLYVGNSGSGTLNIQAGGQVSNFIGNLGSNPGSTGTATVTGSGSQWTNSYNLYVGSSGSGALSIQDGGLVSNDYGYLGSYSGSTGVATVTGSGSQWTNGYELYIGNYGNGTLHIQAGGKVKNANYSYIGKYSGATGTVTVTDPGSQWPISGTLFIGYSGSGTLNIQAGGQTSAYNGYLGYSSGSTGAARVSGSGSQWNNNSDLYVGRSGTGTLAVEAGGQVSDTDGYIGSSAGSTGAVTVTGSGSLWSSSKSLYVGSSGSGSLTVADGGLVTAGTLYASVNDLHGDGTILARGGILDAALVFDGTYGGSHARIAFGTGGSLDLNVDTSGDLGVGYKASGTLRIQGGTEVTSSSGYLGYSSGTAGSATVVGSGSRWTNSKSLYVGNYGSGTLNIEAGAHVSNAGGILAYRVGSTGVVTVTGAASQWTNNGFLDVGNFGTGTLNVAGGGHITAYVLRINTTSSVRMLISGSETIVLGDRTNYIGSVLNNGTIKFYADPFLAARTYAPISEYAGRAMSWKGEGTYSAFGGSWDSGAKTFLVSPATALAAGQSDDVSTGERLLFTDSPSGERVGASFGVVSGGTTFSASRMSGAELSGLTLMPGFVGSVLSAWDFDTNFTGGEALLSFDIGLRAGDLKVWHYGGGTWTPYAADFLTYDSNGIASFITSDFNGYAVTGVPEPASAALLLLGAAAVIRRRRRS